MSEEAAVPPLATVTGVTRDTVLEFDCNPVPQVNKEEVAKNVGPALAPVEFPNTVFAFTFPKSVLETLLQEAEPAPAPEQRQAGKVYNTPKGPLRWTGTGWLAPQ